MPPRNPGEAARAYRLRKARDGGQVLKPTDTLWLSDYEASHPNVNGTLPGAAGKANGTKHFGASRSGRKVKFEMQEATEAVATGSSDAAMMAAAALQERAAGERLDSLTINALKVYENCVNGWEKMATSCRRMLRTYQRDHLDTLRTVRKYYLESSSLQAQLQEAVKAKEQDDDPVNQMVLVAAAKLLGINLPGIDPKVLEQLQDPPPKQPRKS
jgi:hypothetical protein